FIVDIKSAGLAFGTNKADQTVLQGKNLLNAVIGFDGLDVNTRHGIASMDSVRMHIKSSPLKDTTAIASMEASIAMKRMSALTPDSTGVRMGTTNISMSISPSKQDKKIPLIRSNLKFDSLAMFTPAQHFEMQHAGFVLSSIKGKEYKKQWISEGKIGFGSLQLWTDAFPLPITMPRSVLALGQDELILENAALKVGNSDIALTGKFSNLKKVFFEQGTLTGNYSLTSDFIDCNEIMKALSPEKQLSATENTTTEKAEKTEKAPEANDTLSVFVVPDKVDFTMHTRIDKVQLGQMLIENINGDIIVRNQAIELDGLKMHTLAADMTSTLVYRAKNAESAYTGFDVKMKDIQVGRLVELMPALDTLVPMLRSLDGIVNFHIAAETTLNPDMSPRIPTIQAAANLRGDSLVLMDGQTFTEISKMLRFKNKERNVIDSVSVDVLVRNGQIEIYPFRITMDRYIAAVGGKHNLDMSFNYHVSLLQSPIPFKVGVDVKGNMDDFKFRITKPKYKDMNQFTRSSPVDSTSITLRKRITLHK
ncbi:MAG: AsmA-like C-terminal region-containing protein, partial [Bacteroidales bacterium]